MKTIGFFATVLMAFVIPQVSIAGEIESAAVVVVGVDGGTTTVNVPSDIERLYLSKTVPKIARIEGLGQLHELRFLSIEFSDLTETDFSFLAEIGDRVRTLRFTFATLPNRLDFLARMPNLVAFSSQETHRIPETLEIDLSGNPLMEFFEINGGEMDENPNVLNVPESLRAVSFYAVRFDTISLSKWANLIERDIEILLTERQFRHLKDVPDNITDTMSLHAIHERYEL